MAETLAPHRPPQVQHLMGRGPENPGPRPGRYAFAAPDSRVAFVRRTRGTPVRTPCCAPDWTMAG
ncbi:hypothetical protein WDH52_14440 [Streptomyces sp. TRM70308]|uniref:hypothetical protein n=1 Tax=Streptomyces sp. TRM70308 TaxID=3131932 RepID=UPI003D08C16B